MKFKCSLILFMLAANLSFGQARIFDQLDPVNSGSLMVNNERYEKVQGFPYVTQTFMLGYIGISKQNLLFRYNNEADNIEVKFDEEKVYILTKEEKFGSVLIGQNNYVLLNYTNLNGESVYGYLIEKNKGAVSLMKRERIIIKKEKKVETSYDTYEPPKFVRGNDEYYLKLKDNSIVPFPKNKKGVLDLFPTQKQAIEDFIKANKTSFSTESSMMQLAQFISSTMVE
ncbi:hypothetical protein [Flavobacterium sp.]|jgi:hypothetical protein|uniref:hypothetical protein n=1 Tax=Flavobacterium sp. TaxID=239 RepID=UPI0037BF170A